jgi:hypothetical protein
MQAEPTDEILEVIVAARKSGLSRRACMEVVADVFAAPWSGPVSSARQLAQRARGKSHDGLLFSIQISASDFPTTKFDAAAAESKTRGARP